MIWCYHFETDTVPVQKRRFFWDFMQRFFIPGNGTCPAWTTWMMMIWQTWETSWRSRPQWENSGDFFWDYRWCSNCANQKPTFTNFCGWNNAINHPWLGMVNIAPSCGDNWGDGLFGFFADLIFHHRMFLGSAAPQEAPMPVAPLDSCEPAAWVRDSATTPGEHRQGIVRVAPKSETNDD